MPPTPDHSITPRAKCGGYHPLVARRPHAR
jgi:hypothetical protein